jgi:hypothetical protein
MTVTVPATDIPNTLLQAQVAAVQTLVTAATNPADLANQTALLGQLQLQLVMNLIGNSGALGVGRGYGSQANGTPSYILPATVLSTLSINA